MAFMGGSAYAMARDIIAGYILMTSSTIKRYNHAELGQLKFELERAQTTIRSEQPAQDDQEALQFRNRKLTRITGAIRMIDAFLTKKH
jgi:hypothetical protein